MDDSLLFETLSAVAAERGKKYHRSLELATRLIDQWGEENLTDRLFAAIPRECPREVVADLFNILAWTSIENGLHDNGSAQTRTIERWLRENDELRKIQIALNLEVYPFLDRNEMKKVLEDVARRYPEVADRCNNLIRTRRELRE